MTASPRHGDRRNRRWVWHDDKPRRYVTADGRSIVAIPGGGSGEDREEFYCSIHGWVDYGFLGPLLFPVQHRDCQEAR